MSGLPWGCVSGVQGPEAQQPLDAGRRDFCQRPVRDPSRLCHHSVLHDPLALFPVVTPRALVTWWLPLS